MAGEVTRSRIGHRPASDATYVFRAVCGLLVYGAGLALVGLMAGCDVLWGGAFVPGTYMGDVQCTISVGPSPGAPVAEEFDLSMTLTVEDDGGFRVEGVELVLGAEVVRSIPTVDLAFEVTGITHGRSGLTVTYEPRPTLPGIAVEGDLVETYRRWADSVLVGGRAELAVTDVETATAFVIVCAGVLDRM